MQQTKSKKARESCDDNGKEERRALLLGKGRGGELPVPNPTGS